MCPSRGRIRNRGLPPTFSARYVPPHEGHLAAARLQVVHVEFEAEIEEQKYESERGEHLQVVRVGEQHDARRVGAEQDPGQDEQGNGGEAYPPSQAGEDGGREKGAAHGDQGVCVSDGPVPPWS